MRRWTHDHSLLLQTSQVCLCSSAPVLVPQQIWVDDHCMQNTTFSKSVSNNQPKKMMIPFYQVKTQRTQATTERKQDLVIHKQNTGSPGAVFLKWLLGRCTSYISESSCFITSCTLLAFWISLPLVGIPVLSGNHNQ